MQLDPHDIRQFVKVTDWAFVESMEEYKLAKHIYEQVEAAWPQIAEKPRLASLYDQLQRSASSVLLNFCEAMGKMKGWYVNSLCITRGELFETAACIAIFPGNIFNDLKPTVRKLIDILNDRIANAPQK